VIEIQGLWWPADVGEKYKHALAHLSSLDAGLSLCQQRRTAVQAGGNVGLWPRKLAETFDRVYTFEPDARSRECLVKNVPANVTVLSEAIGRTYGECGIQHRSLGSHRVTEDGTGVRIVPIDEMNLMDVDFLQLDVEGYEFHALCGAMLTIARCRPVIQLELRNFTVHYGQTDDAVRGLLTGLGYMQVLTAPGSDVVFRWRST